MKTLSVIVQNLKCGGCANTVKNKLSELEGVSAVEVNVETAEVVFNLKDENLMQRVTDKLAAIGYPIVGDENTLKQKAQSFVSCVVGRVG